LKVPTGHSWHEPEDAVMTPVVPGSHRQCPACSLPGGEEAEAGQAVQSAMSLDPVTGKNACAGQALHAAVPAEYLKVPAAQS
jgi:hypothetical protein